MVGLTGNGSSSSSSGGESQDKVWTVGLINSHLKYLTAETFGHKINANGTALRKKQCWSLVPASCSPSGSCLVLLRSHLGCYLTVDQFGNVTCDTQLANLDEADGRCVFEVEVASDGSGRWSLLNVERRYYLGAGGDTLLCTAKTATADTELWYVQLAARPQINLYNVGRKRFARAVSEGSEESPGAVGSQSEPSSDGAKQLCVDANVPWGADCLVTLHFLADSRLYTLHTSCNMYLHRDGELQRSCTDDCVFSLEYHGGCLALRDLKGLYLSPVGSKAVLRSKARSVGRDELFTLQNSPAQCILIAALNDKLVSVKQGVDVTANQDEVGECERFLLQPCQTPAKSGPGARWRLQTGSGLNWRVDPSTSGVQASSPTAGEDSEFQFDWHDDGSMSVLSSSGRALAAKKSGHLFANAESSELSARFYFHLINRPVLVLKCEQGYIGYKSSSGGADCGFKLECNKVNYEIIRVERSERGQVFFKGESGLYWDVCESGDSVACCSRRPNLALYVELRDSNQLCVKDIDGRYLSAGKNGALTMKSGSADTATCWLF